MEKQRVDVLLVTQGLFDTRERAKRAVMAGEILGIMKNGWINRG